MSRLSYSRDESDPVLFHSLNLQVDTPTPFVLNFVSPSSDHSRLADDSYPPFAPRPNPKWSTLP
jgi:hypothetical protein